MLEKFRPPICKQQTIEGEGLVFPVELGSPEIVRTIPSLSFTPNGELIRAEFNRFPEKIFYPPKVVEAFRIILDRYTDSFDQIVKTRQAQEDGDCYLPANFDGRYFNFGFQIDLVGLPPQLLDELNTRTLEEIVMVLVDRIYEIENSLAMYGLMRGIFSQNPARYSSENFFGVNFNRAVETWEQHHGIPLVLGAVTEEKYKAMLLSEFGEDNEGVLTTEKIKELSGFSGFWGPRELERRIKDGSIENVAIYARTSYPPQWQKKPSLRLEIPLTENPETLDAIRSRAVTFNVDNQREVNWYLDNLDQLELIYDHVRDRGNFFLQYRWKPDGSIYNPNFLNDTKEALVRMGLGYPFGNVDSIIQEVVVSVGGRQIKTYRLNPVVSSALGIPPDALIRAKPLLLHYGCYGHVRGPLTDGDVRSELKRNLAMRGPYMLQGEKPPTVIINESDDRKYQIIHRVFFAYDPRKQRYQFVGGLLNALPDDSEEVRRGRIHGNKNAVWGLIVCSDSTLIYNSQSLNYI